MKRIVKDPEERKRELIDTAERLFMTRGYDQTAISDIVKEVNVSQGAFYYYFESKEDVLVAVMEKNMAVLEKDLRQILERDDMDEAVKLNAMINRFIRHIQSGHRILGFIQHEKSATLHKKLRKTKLFANIAPIMAKVISEGSEKGRFNVSHPLEGSYLLLSLIASALIMLPRDMGGQKETRLDANEYSESLRASLEEFIGRALGARDYKFFLQI